MQRRKEIFIILVLGIGCFIFWILSLIPKKSSSEITYEENKRSEIIINIEGEVVRPIQLTYIHPISYGILFLRIGNTLNEYSDLSGFDLEEMIDSSRTICIPSLDICNQYTPSAHISINSASVDELMMLPQIGEKRANKIIDYIKENGKITTWDIFFKIVGVPENAKVQIQQQAVL